MGEPLLNLAPNLRCSRCELRRESELSEALAHSPCVKQPPRPFMLGVREQRGGQGEVQVADLSLQIGAAVAPYCRPPPKD
jgi:hypothetical protein